MKNRLFNEADVLSLDYRVKILKEITGSENNARKLASRRRFDIYRDQIFKWVIDRLSKEFGSDTVRVMKNRATNISITKKIVNKRAKCYANGVQREFVKEEAVGTIRRILGILKSKAAKESKSLAAQAEFNETMHAISRMLELDQLLKKADRYSELDRICTVMMAPCEESGVDAAGVPLTYKVPKVRVIPSHCYDVIEDAIHPEVARCYILSDYSFPGFMSVSSSGSGMNASPQGFAGERGNDDGTTVIASSGDGRDQIIADAKDDRETAEETFVWWTANYHFTTDNKGKIIERLSPEGNLNPIRTLPFVDVHQDRDDGYWPEGGDDIIEGTILVNVTLTDMFAILNYQGWGQLVVAGKGLKDDIVTGPNKAITFDMKEGDPDPVVKFESASPPIDFWLKAIEQQIALILSTNDLSTRHVAGSLQADNVTSGVGKLVDDAELVSTVADKQANFSGWERQIWQLYRLWHNELWARTLLPADLQELQRLPDFDMTPRFPETKPVLTETEKVDMLAKRKSLRISTLEDLVKMDNPDMGPEDVLAKVEKLREDARANAWFYMSQVAKAIAGNAGGDQGDGEDEGAPEGLDAGDDPAGDEPGGSDGRRPQQRPAYREES